MIIVVDGPDGSGKTHLCSLLRRLIRCHLLSNSGPPTSFEQIQDEVHWIMRFPRNQLLMIDRTRLISEPIYGPILRGKSMIDPGLAKKMLIGLGWRTILCLPPFDRVFANVERTRGEQLKGVPDSIEKIYLAYHDYNENSWDNPWITTFDYTTDSIDDLSHLVTTWSTPDG